MMELKNAYKLLDEYRDFIIDENLVIKDKIEHDMAFTALKSVAAGESPFELVERFKGKRKKEIDSKYIVEGYEDLSVALGNLFNAGVPLFKIEHINKFGTGYLTFGFPTEKELIEAAIWAVECFNERFKKEKEIIEKLKEIECQLTMEELVERYRKQLNILKDAYLDSLNLKLITEASQLETIHSRIIKIIYSYDLVKPVYEELKKLL